MADWASISALATAGGTLVLAGATFGSVRSANRAARAAEQSLLAGLRPLLIPSRLEDPTQKITFMEGKLIAAPGGGGVAEVGEEAVYLGWSFFPGPRAGSGAHLAPEEFTRLTRDLYIPVGGIGFWQGTFREPSSPEFAAAKQAIEARETLTVDILYGDFDGGQRVISRFSLLPRQANGWMATVARHWNIDRPDPR